MGTLDELVAGAQRGWYRPGLGAGAKTFGYMLGFGTDEDLAKDIATRQQSYEAAPQSQAPRQQSAPQQGAALPPPQQRQVGQAYPQSKGYVWTGTGWMKPDAWTAKQRGSGG